MIDPRSYIIDQGNPVNSVFSGFNQGMQLTAYRDAREAAQLKAEQEAQAKEQLNADLSEVASKPSYEGYTRLMTMYPQLSEQLTRAQSSMTEGQQRQATSTAIQGSMLLGAGDIEGAKKVIESRALAYENAGDVNMANAYRSQVKMIDANPEGAKQSLMMIAASGLKPDELPKFFGDLGKERREEAKLQPELDKLEAETAKIETETEWLPTLNQANVDNIESQIEDRRTGRVLQNKQIENQNTQFYANLDQGQKQFLMKLDQAERKLANELNPTKPEKAEERIARLGKVEDYEAAVSNANNAAKNAADLAKDFSKISESTGGYWNKAMRNIPGTDEHAFSQKLETLKSQVFLTQVEKMKGMGALTDAEGARLEKSIDSLDADLDPKVLQKNLRNIESELKRAATKAQKMAELYATRGTGYSEAVVQAAKKRGVTPYEMQKIANEMGY